MKTLFFLIFVLFFAPQFMRAQSITKRKTDYTVNEVKQWVDTNKNFSTWKGWLLYQGSDTSVHHFISRIMDEWIWFNIRRSELKIADERPYKQTSSTPLGYYYVDATKNFVKIKDYQQKN